jgi:hypothetical protein
MREIRIPKTMSEYVYLYNDDTLVCNSLKLSKEIGVEHSLLAQDIEYLCDCGSMREGHEYFLREIYSEDGSSEQVFVLAYPGLVALRDHMEDSPMSPCADGAEHWAQDFEDSFLFLFERYPELQKPTPPICLGYLDDDETEDE